MPGGPAAFLTATADRFAFGSSDRYDVRVYNAGGCLTHVIRNSSPHPVVPAAALDQRREGGRLMRESGTPSRSLEPPLPATGPAFDALLFANDGTLWVRRWNVGLQDREWHVYDADGRMVAVAQLPARFRPTEINGSRILGVWQNETDVESVRLYRLIQRGRTP